MLWQALAGSVGAGAREGAAWAADQISQEVGGAEPFAAAGACPALLGLVRTGARLFDWRHTFLLVPHISLPTVSSHLLVS